MQDYQIYDFDELVNDRQSLRNASLILGNGASIAIDSRFAYSNLLDKADCNHSLSQASKELFKALDTTDFELVMNKLRQTCTINSVLNLDSGNVAMSTYDNIRSSLISAVRATHAQYTEVKPKLQMITSFLEQFRTVLSLNYDLLVYWALMAGNDASYNKMKDCFRKAPDRNLVFDYDIEKLRDPQGGPDPTLVFYPHGNLVLASNENNDEIKIKINNRHNLFEEIDEKWQHSYVPLFVSEGDSKQKLRAIRRSAYLNFVYDNVLPDLGSIAVIYGWRLAEQEDHLIKRIFSKTSIKEALVSIYKGDPDYTDEQVHIVKTIQKESKTTEIKFFDAASKNCWYISN